jgi:SAM-dependent methyltransferase
VNERHLQLCASPEWAGYVRERLLPWVLGQQDLGERVLELGPGPGLTTDVLRALVPNLTAVELDPALAAALAKRMAGSNVEVVRGDGVRLPVGSGQFSAVVSCTMLHHLPAPALQDALFRETRRALRLSGVFIGTDGQDTPDRRDLHEDDIFIPLDPETLPDRLRAAGFKEIAVESDGDRFRFLAFA